MIAFRDQRTMFTGGFGSKPSRCLCLLVLLLLPFVSFGKDVVVRSNSEAVQYGSYDRGDVFVDTLRFMDTAGTSIHVTDGESTCDCVTLSILPSGELAFRFHMEDAEEDGPTEKIVYTYTDSPSFDLVRLVLKATVNPGDGIETAMNPAPEANQPTSIAKSSGALTVLFFHSQGCQTCQRVRDFTFPYLRERWGSRIAILEVDLDDPSGFAQLLRVREHYGVAGQKSPFLFAVGDGVETGIEDLASRMDKRIEHALATETATFIGGDFAEDEAEKEISSLFRSLSFWTVLGAGLLDGINPCAFATLVFFIGLLSYTGSSKRQVLVVGIGFTLSVFVVYLLLGVGAFRALQALAVYHLVSKLIFGLTLLLLLVLFGLSVRDIFVYWRTGKTRDAALQLSRANKKRIHDVMKRGLSGRNLFLGALGIGALVTLFEAACTGQVYLPTIVLVLRDPALRGNAVLYLVLYNLLFVLPLIVVFALTYSGVASKRFVDWSQRHYGLTRLLLSGLFLLLAVLMILQFSIF